MNEDAPATTPAPNEPGALASTETEEPTNLPRTPAMEPAGAMELAAVDEIGVLRRENAELRDGLLRRRADFDNFRRRTERERQSWAAEAEAALVQEIIPTLDHLDQALSTVAPEGGLRDGVELIRRDLVITLARLGLAVHDPVGQAFDPLSDQALLHEETADLPDGTVMETLRKGYRFKERLLRPALVKVAKGASDQVDPTPDGAPSETLPKEVD